MSDDHEPLPRRPDRICARPYVVDGDDEGDEGDTVFCGLERAHAGPHMAIIWFTDSKNDWPPPAEAGHAGVTVGLPVEPDAL